jgi:hypothetical protein
MIKDIILRQMKTYPFMEKEDLYKLLFQSFMGPGHAVNNIFSVVQWMNDEIQNMVDYNDTSTYEDLDPSNGMVRVNLRPFLKSGGSKEKLLNAFIMTANSFKGSRDNLIDGIKESIELSNGGLLPFDTAELRDFFTDLENRGFPAIHHSEKYRLNHKPAYRVIQKKYL